MSTEKGVENNTANVTAHNDYIVDAGRIMVIGSGAREHAIVTKLCQSEGAKCIYVSPGNGGTALLSDNLKNGISVRNVNLKNNDQVVQFVLQNNIGLVIVGPEQPLAEGLCDRLREKKVRCFGPGREGARLEYDKVYAKTLMEKSGVKTAKYKSFSSCGDAIEYLKMRYEEGVMQVVKASGLAAGKGVVVPNNCEEAISAVKAMMEDRIFGDAGNEVIVEDYLEGEELSVFAWMDGKTFSIMPAARDHKRAEEGDCGPNTGGMGACSSMSLLSDPQLYEQVRDVFVRTVSTIFTAGIKYVGVLFAGLMVTADKQVYCLEFNCRFGDPETVSLLPLLKTDFLRVIDWCIDGVLAGKTIEYEENLCIVGVVIASQGYPTAPVTGFQIDLDVSSGSLEYWSSCKTRIYANSGVLHAGTRLCDDGRLLSSGGRVLVVYGRGTTFEEAACYAYARCKFIRFQGAWSRFDIGYSLKEHPLRIAILGSGSGSSASAIFNRHRNGLLQGIKIVLVASNVQNAVILKRATDHGIPSKYIQGSSRHEFESNLISELQSRGDVDVLVLCGFMRILSSVLVNRYAERIINVHPSLLPAHSGLMDMQVHRSVLASGQTISGCTVHIVSEVVDAGPYLVKRECAVLSGDTEETLRARVQELEGPAIYEALMMYYHKLVPLNHYISRRSTYLSSGVDIDVADKFVKRIAPICATTARSGLSDASLGGFASLFSLDSLRYRQPIFVSSTDGVGTKLLLALQYGIFSGIGQDLVAMCVNDVLAHGGEPLFFLDYYSCGKLDLNVSVSIIDSIASACAASNCSLIGGETAEMPGLYGEKQLDLAGFAVGVVEKHLLLPHTDLLSNENIVIGLTSNGLHSNGFSLVRHLLSQCHIDVSYTPPFESDCSSLISELLKPTHLYVKTILPLIHAGLIIAAAHITGGGLIRNIPRVLTNGLYASIDASSWPRPPLFNWLLDIGNIDCNEAFRTWNMGIGFVLIVDSLAVDTVFKLISDSHAPFTPHVIGRILSSDNSDEPPYCSISNLSHS